MAQTRSGRVGQCMLCGGPIQGGVAYVSAGAIWLDDTLQNSIHEHHHQAFMSVGFHGLRPDMSDSADIEVATDVPGGQFELSFCCLDCLKSWFVGIVDSLKAKIAPYRDEDT